MKNRNQRGISLINIILITFIMIAAFIIVLILISRKNNNGTTNEIYNQVGNKQEVANRTMQNSLMNSTDENVQLNNDILNTNQITNTEYKIYYYNQLDQYAKSMYSTVIKNISTIQDGTSEINFEINESGMEPKFQSAWDAITLDKPEIFYIDSKKISLTTQTTTSLLGKVNYKYTFKPATGKTYLTNSWKNKEEVQKAINQVEEEANTIVSNASGSIYDKVKYVHDQIIDKVSYDQTNSMDNSNIYGTLINRLAICEGYAETYKYLLDKLNIPCVIVYGNGVDGTGKTEYHAWNEVKMEDEKWYAVDTTWDDPIIIGGGKLSNDAKYKNFLKGSKTFFISHINEPDVSGTNQNFSYPVLSETDYK